MGMFPHWIPYYQVTSSSEVGRLVPSAYIHLAHSVSEVPGTGILQHLLGFAFFPLYYSSCGNCFTLQLYSVSSHSAPEPDFIFGVYLS